MSSHNISKRRCCTCLSGDRYLFQLYRVPDGVNLLYMLLQCDADAYREGFFKDIASWLVCWECRAIINKIKQFRSQTCMALKLLKDIADGRNKKEAGSLSHLSIHKNPAAVIHTEIFIDCGQVKDIKDENTVDLVENHFENELKVMNSFEDEKQVTDSVEYYFGDEQSSDNFDEIKKVLPKKKKHKKSEKTDKIKKFYSETIMTEEELKVVIENRRLELENGFKCDSCVLGFKSDSELNTHNSQHHTKKMNYNLCHVCLSYIKDDTLDSHIKDHYWGYVCKQCTHKTLTQDLMVGHLNEKHSEIIAKKKRLPKKDIMKLDKPRKYPCSECDMTFENKGAKWKHVQKSHRAGHKCPTCGKIFTFKHNLERHALNHAGGHPCSPCPVCRKPVRTSSLAVHMSTHASRAGLACAPCGVRLACRATYAAHLKYARAHAAHDTLRYACSLCEKKYRSRGELRDHVAYRHDNQPRHKCPVCDKYLATRRCVTRHVKRAHEGLKENARDKMCDYCGKAFRDKKSLSEHVSRHTGARPHACAHCGRAFRQRAALHAHTRRIHAHNT